MASPKISIIIPLYNQFKKLCSCLDSIKQQTLQDYEVIIVNDGSTDINEPNLAAYVQSTGVASIQLYHQRNQGAPIARNNGFRTAHGEYVIFCDADVIMKSEMLERMNAVLDNTPDVSYVYASFRFGWKKFMLWEFDAQRLRSMPYIHTTSLMRRNDFPGFDPRLKRFQDWDLWLTMLERGKKGELIKKILFRVQPGGSMSTWRPAAFVWLFSGKNADSYQRAKAIIQQKHGLTTTILEH